MYKRLNGLPAQLLWQRKPRSLCSSYVDNFYLCATVQEPGKCDQSLVVCRAWVRHSPLDKLARLSALPISDCFYIGIPSPLLPPPSSLFPLPLLPPSSLLPLLSLQRSPRADHFTCFARVEHGPRLLAESGRLEGEGGEDLSLKLETSIQCNTSDPQSLDEIAQNPLLGEHTPPLKGAEGEERGRKRVEREEEGRGV